MEQWTDIAGRFGIPVVIIAAVGWFLYKKVWPFVTEQITEAQAQRKLEVERFVETIRARDTLMGEMQREHLKALTTMAAEFTGEMRALRDEVKNGHK